MPLLRSFWRAVAGASGLGLVVPAALLLVAVTATITGAGGLGQGLRGVFDGPEVPGGVAQVAEVPGSTTRTDAVELPEISEGRTTPGRTTRDTGSRTGTTDDGRTTTTRPTTTEPTTTRPTTTRPTTTTPTTTQPTTTTPVSTTGSDTPTTTTPAKPAETNPIRRLTKGVTENIVRPLPLVGPAAADVVDSVVDLLIPPPGGASLTG